MDDPLGLIHGPPQFYLWLFSTQKKKKQKKMLESLQLFFCNIVHILSNEWWFYNFLGLWKIFLLIWLHFLVISLAKWACQVVRNTFMLASKQITRLETHVSPITKKKVKTLFCVNHQSPETWELAEHQGANCYLEL